MSRMKVRTICKNYVGGCKLQKTRVYCAGGDNDEEGSDWVNEGQTVGSGFLLPHIGLCGI